MTQHIPLEFHVVSSLDRSSFERIKVTMNALHIKQVMKRIGLGKSTIYRMIVADTGPPDRNRTCI
ncbi:AlpA family phage regulatory protein [Burkholderia sp. Ap-962]|nr:AlpA family phage regulatory protein [Burkholderia sp. Ap-962]